MGFDEFRHGLENWGQQQLSVERPAYVGAFKAELIRSANFELAMKAAEPFLQEPLAWVNLLTLSLDVEMARDRLKIATLMSDSDPPDATISRGVWVVYQSDVWLICASGLLERVNKLVVASCRKLISDQIRRNKTVDLLKGEIEKDRLQLKELRDAVAHGGGTVGTLEERRLWEAHLILSVDGFREVITSFHDSSAENQSKWHTMFSKVTSKILTDADVWFDRLSKEVF